MRFSIMSLLFPFTANALSATTANVIYGTAPYLLLSDGKTKLTDLNQLLGFSMPNRDGTSGREQLTYANKDDEIIAPTGMKFSDVYTLSTAIVGDSDGDADGGNGTVTATTMKAEWKEAGKTISNLNQTLSQCGGPYTLTITVDGVAANTTYGKPNKTEYKKGDGSTNETVTYNFTGKDIGICYLRTAEYALFFTGTAGTNIKYANGYNPDVWVKEGSTHKGFKRNAGFPTTGFDKAKFSLIGSGTDQTDYTCEQESGGTWVTYSTGAGTTSLGKGCEITYNTVTRPTTPVTIKMSYKGTKIDSYTLDYTNTTDTKWAIGMGTRRYKADSDPTTSGVFEAANLCAGKTGTVITTNIMSPTDAGKYFFNRNEITNTPIASKPTTDQKTGGYYSRDVDGTFMGEWGRVYSGYGNGVSGSGWAMNSYYWTANAYSTTNQFLVDTGGNLFVITPTYSPVVVMCRG